MDDQTATAPSPSADAAMPSSGPAAPQLSVACSDGRRFVADPARTALLVIDFQRDFLDPGGWCAAAGDDVSVMGRIVPRAMRLVAAARAAGLTLIHTREGYAPDFFDVPEMRRERGTLGTPGPLGRFLIRGEAGHDFIAEMMPHPGEAVIDKPGFSAFHRTELARRLEAGGIERLILCGITSQCCVHSTLRSAVDHGYWCLTVEDACAAFEPAVHEAAMTLIRAESNLFGWIARTDATIAALEAVAEG